MTEAKGREFVNHALRLQHREVAVHCDFAQHNHQPKFLQQLQFPLEIRAAPAQLRR